MKIKSNFRKQIAMISNCIRIHYSGQLLILEYYYKIVLYDKQLLFYNSKALKFRIKKIKKVSNSKKFFEK